MKSTLLIACCCLIVSQSQAGEAFRGASAKPLPNFDKRPGERATPRQGPSPQRAALAELRQRDPAIQVEFDGVVGTPSLVFRPNGFLTRPTETDRPMAPAAVQSPAPEDPHRPIKSFLDDNVRLFGHGSEIVNGARLDRDYITRHSGLRTVVWQQQLDGIPVFAARLTGHITRNGELVNISSRFILQVEQAADQGTPQRAALIAKPTISASEAVARAATNLGESINEKEITILAEDPQAPDKRQEFSVASLKGRTGARLVWLPMNHSSVRLCWQVELTGRKQPQLYRVLIDAQTGQALVRHCLTFYSEEASYRVFTGDSPTPFSPGYRTPSSDQPAEVARQLVTLTALSTNASPNGWIDPGLNELHGNNVDAHLDRNDDDVADLPRTHGSPSRVFDFPLDLTQAPTGFGDASVTELFYWCNWMHDRLFDLGFTEAAGNFQNQNFNRGGLGNDAVEADAQDGGDVNNANFTAPEDGLPGRLQVYLFNGPTPNRDGDFDTEVILHEMTHGLSSRLVGSGIGITASQSQGLGEGWSDFYALVLLSESGDDLDGNYAFGGYTSYQMSGLTQNYYFGIRRYPYSTDLARNPLTFRDIDPRQADLHAGVPLSPLFQSWNVADEVHSLGEVWCAALWEVRANLIRKWGFDAGNQLILELVTDGMKLSPPDPTFLEARDAIIQADLVKTGGANSEELWRGFAKRGTGFSATSPSSDWTAGVTESFDVPDDLLVSPNAAFTSKGPEAGPFEPSSQVLLLSNVGTNVVTWTASKTGGWLDLALTNGSIAVGGEPTRLAVTLNDSAYALPRGIYNDEITFINHVTGRSQTRRVLLQVGQPDYFTQIFENNDNHLDYQTFTFTPDGSESFYSVCREEATTFPTDPALGTALKLGDEDSSKIDLSGGSQVALFDTPSSSLWVAANGYITFRGSASEFVESLATHFSAPRISMLFNDLDPSEDGVVSWAQLEDRVAVTFQDVPNFYALNRNSFQAELFFDGRIRLTYLGVDATGGLVGLSRGGGEPQDFEGSDFLKYGPCWPALQVTIPAACNESDGAVTGSVQIATALDHALIVSLKSLDAGKLSVPGTVTLSPGTTSVDFPLLVADNAELDGTKVVRVVASADEFRDGSARIQIRDNETAVLAVQIPAVAREGDGFLPGSGTVTVSPTPSRNVVVNLSSSRPGEAEPSPVVVIPSGQTSATFDLWIHDDGEIDGPNPVLITAHVDNWVEGSALITVLDNERADLTVTVRLQVAENSGVLIQAGTVRLSGTLDHDLVVSLGSSDPTKITVPLTVTVPKGETKADFNLTVLDNDQIDGARTITISAQAPGFSDGKADVLVNDDETPPVPSAPQPTDRSTNAPPNLVFSWGTGQGEILANGGFETGDLSGWVQDNSGDGSFVINDGLLDPAGPEDPSPPLEGNFSITSQQGAPGRLVLFQDVTLPAGALSAVLSWHDRIRNYAALDIEPDQQFRVEVRTTDNQLLTTAFTTSSDLPLLNDWAQRTFDLTSYIGKTIRIAFVVQATYGFFNVSLDEVSLWLGNPLPTTYDVYFGANPNPGAAEYLGNTNSNRWPLPKLEIGKTYYWSVTAKRGDAQALGPVWQFSVPGVGPVDHFAWEPIPSPEFLNVPFPVTLVAQDIFDNPATNFAGTVALSAEVVFPETDIGTGTNRWEYPLGGFLSDSRTQVLYLPGEVGPARRLTALAMYVTTPRGAPLNRFTIRMKHSPLRNYPAAPVWERTGWTTVYQQKQNLEERGWVTFNLCTPFQYDGVNSLMLDFSYKGSDVSTGGDCVSSMTWL